MAGRLQLRRGTTSQNDAFTGAIGELTLDTQKKQIRLHDGSTQGGCGLIDPVVAFQMPTSSNNYTWYRKYASGWVEMGGAATIPGRSGGGGSEVIVNLPVTMANTTYQASISIHDGGSYWASWGEETSTRTTTTLRLYAYLNASADAVALPVFWEVKGLAA